MTIDEIIQIERYCGKKDKKALEELQKEFPMIDGIMDNNIHEKIAELLEELKVLRAKEQKSIYTWLNDVRIDIIDEFAKRLKKDLEKMSGFDYGKGIRGDNEAYGRSQAFDESADLVDEIAEFLKG